MEHFRERTPEEIAAFEKLPKEEQNRHLAGIIEYVLNHPEAREEFVELLIPHIAPVISDMIREEKGKASCTAKQ